VKKRERKRESNKTRERRAREMLQRRGMESITGKGGGGERGGERTHDGPTMGIPVSEPWNHEGGRDGDSWQSGGHFQRPDGIESGVYRLCRLIYKSIRLACRRLVRPAGTRK